MIKKIFKYLTIVTLISIVYMVCLIFIPRTYEVQYGENYKQPQFWDLSTGSKISYISVLTKLKEYVPKTPVIYLHGGPGGKITKGLVEDLIPLTDNGYSLYFYDQIGSGHSKRLENIEEYTVERHVEDLNQIINQIGAEEVTLIGQSWGAVLLTQFLAKYPERVKQAIFISPGSIFPIQKKLRNLESPDSLNFVAPQFSNQQGNQKISNLRSKTAHWYAYSFGKKLMPDKEADQFFTVLNQELNKSTVCDASNAINSTNGSGYYAHIMTMKSLSQTTDVREKLKMLDIPVLVMKGQCDNQPWGFTQEYLMLFPNSQLNVVKNAGHSIAIEQPELYIETIRAFLK